MDTESQIVFALKQAETGTSSGECRKLGISEATLYNSKKKFKLHPSNGGRAD